MVRGVVLVGGVHLVGPQEEFFLAGPQEKFFPVQRPEPEWIKQCTTN